MMFRWFALVAVLASLGISIHYRRRARQEGETIPRRRERLLLMVARAVLALPLFGAILTYLVNPGAMEWASFGAPPWFQWTGVVLGFVTVPAVYWVFSSIGLNISETVLTKNRHELVTHGPYRWIRHPLYTTGLVLIAAVGLMASNWFILLFGLIALVSVLVAVIPTEEWALLDAYGVEYREYMEDTGRLLPRVLRRR